MKRFNYVFIIVLLTQFGLIPTKAGAIECYPPPDPIQCTAGNSLCIAADICNNVYREALEPNEGNKTLFEYEVRNAANKWVRSYCEWKKGLVLPIGRTYCP